MSNDEIVRDMIKTIYYARIVLIKVSRRMGLDGIGYVEIHDIDWCVDNIDKCIKNIMFLDETLKKYLIDFK